MAHVRSLARGLPRRPCSAAYSLGPSVFTLRAERRSTDRASVSQAAARRGAPPLPACRSGPSRAARGLWRGGVEVGCRDLRGAANGWRQAGRPTARSGRAPPGDGWSEDGGAARRQDPLATGLERGTERAPSPLLEPPSPSRPDNCGADSEGRAGAASLGVVIGGEGIIILETP